MPNLEPLLKIAAQKIFVSVEIKRDGKEISHTLVIQNQSEFTVCLIEIITSPNIPLGFGNNLPIDSSKIFKNKTLIPGQKIENVIDKKSIKDPRKEYEIKAKYKFLFMNKEIPTIQTSNTYRYRLLDHSIPVRSTLYQNFNG